MEEAAGRVAALAGEHGGVDPLCAALGLDAAEVEAFCSMWFTDQGKKPSWTGAVTLFMLGVQVGRELESGFVE